MERLTIKKEEKILVKDFDEACKRLSQFEDFYFDLIENQKKSVNKFNGCKKIK